MSPAPATGSCSSGSRCATRRRGTTYYACNPLTRELARIPAVAELVHSFNLAFDPSVSPHYKVVGFGYKSLVQFVLEGGHLKTIPMPPNRKKGWFCAYIGESAGHLQMIGYTKEEKLTACFEILEMQRGRPEWSHLCRVDLGRVKELHPEIEWPTWDTRSMEHKVIGYLALSPVCVVRGTGEAGKHGVLIFSIPGKIMLYDMKD